MENQTNTECIQKALKTLNLLRTFSCTYMDTHKPIQTFMNEMLIDTKSKEQTMGKQNRLYFYGYYFLYLLRRSIVVVNACLLYTS